jgi:hypothetical protein
MNTSKSFLLVILVTASAGATPILGLFPSGVDNTGALLSVGQTDPHYTLNGGAAIVATPAGPWITSPLAMWICLTSEGYTSVPALPPYNYTTTFVLPSNAVPDSVFLTITRASDDGVTVFVNGNNTQLPGLPQTEFSSLNTFSIAGTSSPFFTIGTNTLTFQVNNAPLP